MKEGDYYGKKTIIDEVFGKITYKEEVWLCDQKINILIGERIQTAKVEIDSVNPIYDEIQLGMINKEIAEIYLADPNLVNEAEILSDKRKQQDLYKDLLINNHNVLEKNIENAAIETLAEILEDNDEQSLSKVIGKEKATKLYMANTVKEKLESLQISIIHIFTDYMEIKCECDWYEYGGGFVVLENGECMMRPIDCLSI